MTGASWWTRVAAAVATLVILSFGGWTHQTREAQYLGASATIPAATPSPGAAPGATHSTSADRANAAAVPTGKVQWLSGAAGDRAANGTYGRWRGSPVQFGGTWDNGNAEQVELRSICPGGAWARWYKPLDVAVGAIDRRQGESWAKAARGAYDARWRRSFVRMKACWGSRDPANLYIRFAHEMNLKDMRWQVRGGEEADFVRAFTRYSNLRYRYLPEAKLVLCPSDGTSSGLDVDIHKLWPGKDAQGRQVADIYAIDTYNSWVFVRTAKEFQRKLVKNQSGMPLGMEKHRMLAEGWGVPFAVPEWSNNGDPNDEGKGSEAPQYVQLMNEWFRQHAGDPAHPRPGELLYEIHFNLMDQFSFFPTRHQPKTATAYRKLSWGK